MGVERTGETDTRTETADQPASSERPYAPPPDNPGSPGQPSRLESRARAREQPQEGAPQEAERPDKPTQPQNENSGEASTQDKDEPQKDDDKPQVNDTVDETEPRPGRTEETTDEAPEDETTDQLAEPQETRADSDAPDNDRGKKAEDDNPEQLPDETSETNPEAPANPILSNVYTDSRGNVRIEPRYGREQPSEPAQSEAANTDSSGLPTREALDPAGAHPEPGRADLRNPEDDPENQDLLDDDMEGLDRWKKSGREFIRRPDDVAKTTEALAKDLGKLVKWDRPTGVAESKQAIEAKPHHESIQGANAAIGALGAGIVLYEVARRARAGIRNIREKMTGAEGAHN